MHTDWPSSGQRHQHLVPLKQLVAATADTWTLTIRPREDVSQSSLPTDADSPTFTVATADHPVLSHCVEQLVDTTGGCTFGETDPRLVPAVESPDGYVVDAEPSETGELTFESSENEWRIGPGVNQMLLDEVEALVYALMVAGQARDGSLDARPPTPPVTAGAGENGRVETTATASESRLDSDELFESLLADWFAETTPSERIRLVTVGGRTTVALETVADAADVGLAESAALVGLMAGGNVLDPLYADQVTEPGAVPVEYRTSESFLSWQDNRPPERSATVREYLSDPQSDASLMPTEAMDALATTLSPPSPQSANL